MAIEWYEYKDVKVKTPFKLNDQQVEGLNCLVDFYVDKEKLVFTLAGFAGTGKSTIIRTFCDYVIEYEIKKNQKNNFSSIFNEASVIYTKLKMTSPTHRANAVLAKSTGRDCKTIHSLVGLRPNIELDKFNAKDMVFSQGVKSDLFPGDILIIDESSMINNTLESFIRKRCKELNVKIIYLGDSAQLRPVGQTTLSKAFEVEDKYTLSKVERTKDSPLLAEITQVRTSGIFTGKSEFNEKNEGVLFTSDLLEFYKSIINSYKSSEFLKNKNLLRVLAADNKTVTEMNRIIRTGIYGERALTEEYINGDLLMGYSNYDLNYKTKKTKVANSADYIAHNVIRREINIGTRRYNGYYVTLEPLMTENSSGVFDTIFIISKYTSTSDLEYLGELFETLRQKGVEASKKYNEAVGSAKTAAEKVKKAAWSKFYSFCKSFATPVNIYHNDVCKITKTLDYGYCHTTHKSQGGTYDTIYVNGRSIDVFGKQDDPSSEELRRQLKYVALSRAKYVGTILN